MDKKEKGGQEEKKTILVSLFCKRCGSHCGSQHVEVTSDYGYNEVSWCGNCNEINGMK